MRLQLRITVSRTPGDARNPTLACLLHTEVFERLEDQILLKF